MRFSGFLIVLLVIFIVFAILHKPLMREICPIEYSKEILLSSGEMKVSPYLIASIIRVESNFRKDALSPKGATGLMQLMPSTAQYVAELKGLELDNTALIDPATNIALGTYYYKLLFDHWGKIVALASYNAGRGNVEKWLSEGVWDGTWENRADIPFHETKQFLIKVITLERWYTYLYRQELSGEFY
ncbi:MAG: lytic transglycosylase domain-containing protein [Firmicutes bacterium]|nr:lytic transglycosylase domain-containing protein [Bacillota bacterium]MDD4264258.1 lytic transglycosylase domain-containing protein [Bacillota bacterium]MDD4694730.1 lytic transglycosylase domain-containing protein [Bacillota bacterium]